MKDHRILWLVANVLTFALLWAWGGYFWYRRSHFAFYVDPNRLPTNLKMPTGVGVSKPEPARDCRVICEDVSACDDYVQTMFRAATVTSSPTTVICDISEMDRLFGTNPELFLRYLATSPAWALREYNDGKRRISQRCRWADGCWHDQLDCRYLTGCETGSPLEVDTLTNLDGEDIYGRRCLSGERVDFPVRPTDEETREIVVVCQGTNLSMMVSEFGPRGHSRLMQPTFDFIQREFHDLAAAGDWKHAIRLLPSGAVRRGAPEMTVFRDIIRHLSFEAWVNPGEKGKVYLKAFEVTRGIALTLDGVGGAPVEYVGWSADTDEKFYVSDDFSFREYSEENDFAARIEVWFRPANGGPDRKLIERVFRIDGGCDEDSEV